MVAAASRFCQRIVFGFGPARFSATMRSGSIAVVGLRVASGPTVAMFGSRSAASNGPFRPTGPSERLSEPSGFELMEYRASEAWATLIAAAFSVAAVSVQIDDSTDPACAPAVLINSTTGLAPTSEMYLLPASARLAVPPIP